MSQQQNKAWVILVSFFGAMVTVMEKVRLSFVILSEKAQKIRLQSYSGLNFETHCHSPSTRDFMPPKMLSNNTNKGFITAAIIIQCDLLATLKTNASEINNATI